MMSMGLCFFKEAGQLILVNLKMEKLSQLLCGTALQNGESFWQMISQGDLKQEHEEAGSWTFRQCIAGWKCVDLRQKGDLHEWRGNLSGDCNGATELYALSSKLKRENSVLRGMSEAKSVRPQGG